MTHNDWEEGTIVLPTAHFARVKRAVQDADTAHKEKVFELTQVFWGSLTRKEMSDPAAYRAAVNRFVASRYADPRRSPFGSKQATETNNVLQDASAEMLDYVRLREPSRVIRTDMAFPTNRTTVFTAPALDVSFDKKTSSLLWSVDENNRAVENARSHPLGIAVFEALDDLRWTRGTGGYFTGNDEHHSDPDHGGGENYVSLAFGPVGAEHHPDACRPFTDSRGRRFTQEVLTKAAVDRQMAAWAAQGAASRAAAAQPRGHNGHAGKFTYRNRGESPVTL